METRQVIQIRVYFLRLNHMQCNTEQSQIVAISTDLNRLLEWEREQRAPERWKDESSLNMIGNPLWKTYKQGSPIEFFNAPPNMELDAFDHYGHGVGSEWLYSERAEEIFASNQYEVICCD